MSQTFSEYKKSEEFKNVKEENSFLNDTEKLGDIQGEFMPSNPDFRGPGNNKNYGDPNDKSTKDTPPPSPSYVNPLRKIGGGGVLQYPIDLDTDLQDYFEIQIFRYRSAGNLPDLTTNNQGYNKDAAGNLIDKTSPTDNNPKGTSFGGYFAGSNRRGNRQNFRLQDLQSTIQLPMPPSIKDMNAVDFAGGTMSGAAAAAFSPVVSRLLGQGPESNPADLEGGDLLTTIKSRAETLIAGGQGTVADIFTKVKDALQSNKGFKRISSLQAIAQAVGALGVSIDVDQAITRTSGAVRNPNLELLFKGPALRNFSFTIRLTPRDADESKRVRMIIRALKQHSAVKRNPQIFSGTNDIGSNFLLGTPDVFKLRYIKARTQRDIKGLNKFKTCALNSISVDYTGEVGRFAAYEEDSQPVTTIISLSFTELVPLYDADYAEFTTDDDVGL